MFDLTKETGFEGRDGTYTKFDDIDISDLRNMSNRDIEHYGTAIQESISEKSNELLSKSSANETGEMKKSLDELEAIVDKRTKSVPTVLTPLLKVKNFISGYQKVEGRVEGINKALEEQKDKLDVYVASMEEQSENLNKAVVELADCECKLQVYVNELQSETDVDTARLQVAANRLKIITATRVNAEQASLSSSMIISANRESKHQIEEVITNVLPILKMQAVNAIGIRANKESMEIAERTRKITGELIERNARDVKEMQEQLANNRGRSIIDEDKLIEAQKILKEALESVAKASEKEAENNIKIAESLRKSALENQAFIEKYTSEK